jgi:hypothetical protein
MSDHTVITILVSLVVAIIVGTIATIIGLEVRRRRIERRDS